LANDSWSTYIDFHLDLISDSWSTYIEFYFLFQLCARIKIGYAVKPFKLPNCLIVHCFLYKCPISHLPRFDSSTEFCLMYYD